MNANQPAYPHICDNDGIHHPGLTKREDFAKHITAAYIGIFSSPEGSKALQASAKIHGMNETEFLCRISIETTDGLLAELERTAK